MYIKLCGDVTDLDVWVHIHKSPLAVVTIDAECQLHLFVKQNTHFDSLFLQEKVQREAALFEKKKIISTGNMRR